MVKQLAKTVKKNIDDFVGTWPCPNLSASIRHVNSQEKYFVHISELIDEVKEGDNVSFEIERGMKGMNAVRVKKV